MLFGATFKSNFKNVDVIRRGVNSRFVSPGRIHFFGYKISSISLAKADATSFTEPDFPLAGVGIFNEVTSKATKDIFGSPVDLLSVTNIDTDNGFGASSTPALTSFEAEAASNSESTELSCEKAAEGSAINVAAAGESLTFDSVIVPAIAMYLIKV